MSDSLNIFEYDMHSISQIWGSNHSRTSHSDPSTLVLEGSCQEKPLELGWIRLDPMEPGHRASIFRWTDNFGKPFSCAWPPVDTYKMHRWWQVGMWAGHGTHMITDSASRVLYLRPATVTSSKSDKAWQGICKASATSFFGGFHSASGYGSYGSYGFMTPSKATAAHKPTTTPGTSCPARHTRKES